MRPFFVHTRASLITQPPCFSQFSANISLQPPAVLAGTRPLSTQSFFEQPPELSYDLYVAPDGNTSDGALVIAHGLLGSKRNWATLSRSFASTLRRPVYALDMRNHGHSPAVAPHDYHTMASDVGHFIHSHGLWNVQLIGHSMGGKAVMAYALSEDAKQDDRLERLVVVDTAPSAGAVVGQEFIKHIQAMKHVNEIGLSSRKEAQAALSEVESDPGVLAFLMTNLEVDSNGIRFRPSLDTLLEYVNNDIGRFPYRPGEVSWDGPTLFVKGKKSAYINPENQPIVKRLFPNMKLEVLDGGHWVHAERPNEFKEILLNFLGRRN